MLGELLRYGLVGSLTAFIFAGSVWGLGAILGAGIATTVLSYTAAVSVQYVGHTLFTFKRDLRDAHQWLRFILTHALGVTISIVTINLIAPALHLPSAQAAMLVICLLAALNFCLFRFWTFAKPSKGNQK